MRKRIMTVDEFYEFCLQNNFSKFDGTESGDELVIEMPGKFEKDKTENSRNTEGMTQFVSRAFHDKVNLNKSKIETDTFKENLPSSHLRPILANILKDEETGELDFGSHDYHTEIITETDDDGNTIEIEKVVYDEQPIGVIDGTQNAIEYDEDADVNRAVLHGYLYNNYCQDAIDILNRRGTVDCSVELSIRAMSFDAQERVLVLDDFYVSALTLLSAKVNPGMAGSNFKIEDFEMKKDDPIKFNKEEKLIDLLENINNLLSNFNDKEEHSVLGNSKKGGNATVDKEKDMTFDEDITETEEVTETEESTEEEVAVSEEESEEVTVESSEEETEDVNPVEEETVVENQLENTVEYSFTINGEVKKFAVSLQEKIYAIQDLVNATYADADNTYYGVTVYDDYVIMQDWWNGKYFKQNYEEKDEAVFTLTGDRVEVFVEFVTADEQKELDTMRSEYSALKEFKANIEKNELHAKIEEIINSEKYSVLAEKDEEGNFVNSDFAKLVSEMDNYSLADLETKVKVMHSDYVISHAATFAVKEEKQKKKVLFMANSNSDKEAKKKAPYGGIFEKYNK